MSRWSTSEDTLLLDIMQDYGHKWRIVASVFNKKNANRHRSTDSIRHRWNRMHINLLCQEIMPDLVDLVDTTEVTDFSYNEIISALDQHGTTY